MPELLLELLSEEIPARMQQRAARDLEKALNDGLLAAGYMPEGVRAFATPRRLAASVLGLPSAQPDRREEKKGPRRGAPEKAVAGFLRSAGLTSLDACEIREDKKGAYYVAVIEQSGRQTAAVIAELVDNIVRGFAWPKSMRWGPASADEGALRWVRPLHRVLCVFDGETVSLSIAGLQAGDVTEGHRFLAPAPIQARNFERYASALRAANVILDGDERAALIERDAKTLCAAQGLELVEDNALLSEVAGLAEWPVVMIGAFNETFLTLPDEVLTASMRGHQKYFSVRNPDTGRLANKFIFVANIETPDGGRAMRAGYERVLTARLSDAWYLYHQDLKTPLRARLPDLERIAFFEGLGSVGDKARRVAALAGAIAPLVGADCGKAQEGALLGKADLVTGMVGEFPALQGVMGGYYHRACDGDDSVADAIRDHYKPQGQDDQAPGAPVSLAVALADKIDTLSAFWSINKKPTGSGDPFALRRAALGCIRMVIENRLRIKFRWLFTEAALDEDGVGDLLAFFHDRLRVYLREKGHRHDHIAACLCEPGGEPGDDFTLIADKLAALETFLATEDGVNLVSGFKRSGNILKPEKKTGALPAAGDVREDALQEAEEQALFAALGAAEAALDGALDAEDFARAMTALAELRAPIDAFFDAVTVNADDPDLRRNRLALLVRFEAAAGRVADFAKLEG